MKFGNIYWKQCQLETMSIENYVDWKHKDLLETMKSILETKIVAAKQSSDI